MISSSSGAPAGPHNDCRIERATRYEPCHHEACLSWRGPEIVPRGPDDGSGEPPLFALLLDISQTGAAVALDRVPRPDEGVWLRVDAEGRTDWTEADVVGVTRTARGPHLVRLAFRGPLPDRDALGGDLRLSLRWRCVARRSA